MVKPVNKPSFYENAANMLDIIIDRDSDIIVRFQTYYENATAGLGCPYHRFDIAIPQEGVYTIEAADESLYKNDALWSESNVVSFSPTYGMENISTNPLIFNVYKDGELVDSIRLNVETATVNVTSVEGKEAEDTIRMISSCDSDNLNVVYYNYNMFTD